jgi:hypothetical protein
MREFVFKLGKHNINFGKELFYVLLNCIDPSISKFEDLIDIYKERADYESLKEDYRYFYDYILNFFHSMAQDNEIELHRKLGDLIDILLEERDSELEEELKIVISNVIDIVFLEYYLDISNFNTNEEIKKYLLEKIKNEKIVNFLVLLLLADTTLTNRDLESIPEDEFENILTAIILISIYICKERDDIKKG